MSQRKRWSALGLAAAMALAANAFAQSGTGSGMPGTMPPDTTAPTGSALPKSPSAGATGGDTAQSKDPDAANTDESANAAGKSTTTSHKKHSKKKKAQTPKPVDNDNNAMPNTASPPSTPTPQ
jgi:hypothetical protein